MHKKLPHYLIIAIVFFENCGNQNPIQSLPLPPYAVILLLLLVAKSIGSISRIITVPEWNRKNCNAVASREQLYRSEQIHFEYLFYSFLSNIRL